MIEPDKLGQIGGSWFLTEVFENRLIGRQYFSGNCIFREAFVFAYILCWLHAFVVFFCFLAGEGFELRAKQVLYHLNHTSRPFCSGYFGNGGLMKYLSGWPQTVILSISVSQVVGTGVSHLLSAIANGLKKVCRDFLDWEWELPHQPSVCFFLHTETLGLRYKQDMVGVCCERKRVQVQETHRAVYVDHG
jgi:hypothetical protein